MQAYSDPERENDKWSLPDVEIFYADDLTDENDEPMEPGYYFWSCFPGCMPDSEPFGPYETEQEAFDAMREIFGE